MPPLSILLLGDANRPEFRDAVACLKQWAVVEGFPDPDSAVAALAAGRVWPDAIVIAQAFPGQFSHQAIERLRRSAPLARVLGLMGSWCEGETRSGSPWPAVARTYWHQWPVRCHRALHRLTAGQCCWWALPATASEEERLLADTNSHDRRPHPDHLSHGEGTRGLVVIRSRSFDMADWLSAACHSRGFATVWQRESAAVQVEKAVVAIFDGAEIGDEECDQLRRFTAELHPVAVVAVLSFPRVEDHRRALSAGAAVVLSKPLTVDDLLWEIEAVVSG